MRHNFRPMARWARLVLAAGFLLLLPSCQAYYDFIGYQPQPEKPAPPKVQPAAAQAHWEAALDLKAKGRLEEAAARLEQALVLDPNLYHGYYQLGLIRQELGQEDQARQIWMRGLSMARTGPDRADYPRQRAIGQLEAALTSLGPPPALAPPPAKGKTKAKTASRSGPASGGYAVLFSSNLKKSNAFKDKTRLNAKGHQVTIRLHKDAKGRVWHRVWVGCCTSRAAALKLAATMARQGLGRHSVMRAGR